MLLAAAGKKFEDNRIEFADWPKLKPSKYDMGGWITCDFCVLFNITVDSRYLEV